MTQPEVIDRAALNDLLATTGNDSTFLVELIDSYLEDAVEQLAAMWRAVNDADAERLRRAAHSLKSTSASLGARKLAGLCQQVEQHAREGTLGLGAESVASLEAAFVEVDRELRLLRPA